MGHSKNRGRRRLTLPLPLRAKMIGCAMFIGGFMGLIASAQLDPITAHVERVIDGDTAYRRRSCAGFSAKRRGIRGSAGVYFHRARAKMEILDWYSIRRLRDLGRPRK